MTLTPDRDVESLGRTTIAGRTVERMAAQVLTEVDDVGGSVRHVLGIAFGSGVDEHDGDAQVDARIDGSTVRLAVCLSVTYPASVRRTTEAARTVLTRRVGELTGLTVEAVDITVTALHSPAANTRRVE